MKTLTVLRIEHSDGIGMFMSRHPVTNNFRNHAVSRADELHYLVDRHESFPRPQGEGIEIYPDEFCAFASVGIFNDYIETKDIQLLKTYGYRLYMFTVNVDAEKIGSFQVVYQKENILEKIDVTNFF